MINKGLTAPQRAIYRKDLWFLLNGFFPIYDKKNALGKKMKFWVVWKEKLQKFQGVIKVV